VSTTLALHLPPELAGHLVPARRLEERRGFRPSGVAWLDQLLGGGWPRAAVSELSGRRSSGRTAVVLASLARAISAGEAVALVDAGGALDPRAAAAAGVALPRLLWIRCRPEQALKAADLVVAAGGFDLCALDLGDGWLRPPTAAWIRLKHGVERQGTSLLVATPARAVGAFAAAAVELSAATPTFSVDEGPTLFEGLRVRATCQRGKHGKHDKQGKIDRLQEEARCAWLAFISRS
jgi:hypothetical protein